MILTKKKRHLLLSSGGQEPESIEFSGVSEKSANPIIELESGHANYRDQKVLDEIVNIGGTDSRIMLAMEGDVGSELGIRRGIVVWTTPHATSKDHVWTFQEDAGGVGDEYILESGGVGEWDRNIDCMMPWRKEVGDGWHALYTDFTAGKAGYASHESENFLGSKFTKGSGNPIIDFTGAGRYVRHITKAYLIDGVYTAFCEVREGAANNPGVTNRWIGKLQCDEADFPGSPSDWTLTEVIKAENFGADHLLGHQHHIMPDIIRLPNAQGSDGYIYYLIWQTNGQDTTVINTWHAGTGAHYAYSLDGCATFQIVTTARTLFNNATRIGDFDRGGAEEFSWMLHGDGTMDIIDNGQAGGGSNYEIGYFRLAKGTFDNTLPDDLFNDNFDGVSIDNTKWTVTPNTGGISLVQRRGKLAVISDGSQDTPLTKMLESINPVAHSLDDVTIELAFSLYRKVTAGGDVEVRIGNAAGTRYLSVSKGSTRNSIVFNRTGLGTSYSQSLNYSTVDGKLKIAKWGPFAGVWENLYNEPSGKIGGWLSRTVNGDSQNGNVVNVSSWTGEDLYVSIWASNVSGTATETVLNDLQVRPNFSQLHDPYVISDIVLEEQQEALHNHPNATSDEQAAIEEMIERMITHDNTLAVTKWIRSMWRNCDHLYIKNTSSSTDSYIDLKYGIADTNNGTAHSTNGHTFDGSDNIDTNIHLRNNVFRYNTNKALIATYIHTIGTLGANRTFYSATAGTEQIRVYYAHSITSMRFRMNSGLANDFTVAGAPADDLLFAVARVDGTGSGGRMWKNGVAQTVTGGAGAGSNTPNEDLLEGSDADLANPLTGTILGLRWIGSPNGFDGALHNTILRETLLS